MKISAFVIFIIVVLVIYGLVSYYLFIRGYQAISLFPSLKFPYIILFSFFTSCYIIARLTQKIFPAEIASFFHFTGSLWLGAVLYFSLFLLLFDLLRLVHHFFPFWPKFILSNYQVAKFGVFIFTLLFVGTLLGAGFYNARHTVNKELQIHINKKAGDRKSMRIVCASDIHLGWIIGKKKFSRIVDTILAQKPDIILFAGDMLDEDILPVLDQNMGEDLLRLKAPLGVYAVTGNHEYIGGISQTAKYLTDHSVTLLRDTVVKIDNSFYLAGRVDRDALRFAGRDRMPVSEILKDIDKSLPVILMDHQPFNLNEAVENGVDLQLSGHTHHGQMWPVNLITRKIFEVSWGYLKKQNTHFYVSSGVGTWGPPVRIGNKPEIVVMDIRFE